MVGLLGNALRAIAEAARRAVAAEHAAPENAPAPLGTWSTSAPAGGTATLEVGHTAGGTATLEVDHTALTPEERGPFLLADLYWQDLDGKPDWQALLAATWGPDFAGVRHRYAGVLLKATEGTSYYHSAIEWFRRGWRATAIQAHGRIDFVRGAYHFLRYGVDGAAQADYYLRVVESAGGWGVLDMLPVLDVEDSQPNLDALARAVANYRAARPADKISKRALEARIIEQTAAAFVARIKARTGRATILYGGSALIERGIKLRDTGCRWLWPAAYTERLSSREATALGATMADVACWQYTDGDVAKAITTRGTRLPRIVPGFGAVDCSVFVGGSTWPDVVHVLCGDPPEHDVT